MHSRMDADGESLARWSLELSVLQAWAVCNID